MFTVPSDINQKLVNWRRDLHQHPEVGWTEFRTASLIAQELSNLGFSVKVGKEVLSENRMGVPSVERLEKAYQRAMEHGGVVKYLEQMKDGYTGVVGTIIGEQPGPTIAFRFDMDALDILESKKSTHVPFKDGFRSLNDGEMHACGHDAHCSIGIGLATVLSANKNQLQGTIKLIFQPAEEGVRGAKSMVEAGVVDDVQYFLSSHVGTGVPLGTVIAGTDGFLATSKINARFKGKAAHAGAEPEQGNNALLAAASAILGLHSIPRHSGGASRVNVGTCMAGDGRNIIPAHATLQLETRGETGEVHAYMHQQAIRILEGAASMYGTSLEYEVVGEARTCSSSDELKRIVYEAGKKVPEIKEMLLEAKFAAGSEDATFMMEQVQKQGGFATYAVFGTTLAAGHHHEEFDIDEGVLSITLQTWLATLEQIWREEKNGLDQ